MVCVGVLEERDEALDHEAGVEGRDPVVLDGLGADFARVLLDVRVEDLGLEMNLGRLEWVIVRKVDVHDELASLIGGVVWADHGRVPVGEVVTDKGDAHALNRVVVVQVRQLLHHRTLA